MALVDALGNLIRFVLLPGQRHDSIGVEPLITGLDFEALIGDKAFDNNWLRANLNERGAAAVIPSKADRAGRIPHDAEMYKAPFGRELLLLPQNIPTHRNPLRKDGCLFCRTPQSHRGFPRNPVIVNRP
jgi:transposase